MKQNLPGDALVNVAHRLESEDRKYYDTGVNCGERVANADENYIANTVVIRSVVAAEGYQRTKGKAKTVKNLSSCIQPDGRFKQHVHLGKGSSF